MQTAIMFMGSGITTVILGLIMFMVSLNCFTNDIKKRVYPGGNTQPLATVCQVDEKIESAGVKKFTGYVYYNKEKRNCWVLGESENTVYVGWKSNCVEADENNFKFIGDGVFSNYKWVPKKDFHRYHNLTQVSKEELKKILK